MIQPQHQERIIRKKLIIFGSLTYMMYSRCQVLSIYWSKRDKISRCITLALTYPNNILQCLDTNKSQDAGARHMETFSSQYEFDELGDITAKKGNNPQKNISTMAEISIIFQPVPSTSICLPFCNCLQLASSYGFGIYAWQTKEIFRFNSLHISFSITVYLNIYIYYLLLFLDRCSLYIYIY